MVAYPLSLPAGAGGFRTANLRPVNVVGESRSPFTGAGDIYAWPGQWWEAELSLPPLIGDRAEIWAAWLTSLKGKAGSFLIGASGRSAPRGAGGGVPRVNGAGQVGGTLVLDGATASVAGWLLAGDYIQLGSAETSRLYKVLADADSDVGGNVSLDLWPDIVQATVNNALIVISGARGLFRLAANDIGWSHNDARFYGITLPVRSEP